MSNQLERLQSDSVSYREAVDKIFSEAPLDLRAWQSYFFEVLICASQLYLDYLLVTRELPALEAVSKASTYDRVETDIRRESTLRKKLREKLESSLHWEHFSPENPFSEDTGLRTLQNYIDSFAHHLPEIYEESFRVEYCAKSFLNNQNGSALAQMIGRIATSWAKPYQFCTVGAAMGG